MMSNTAQIDAIDELLPLKKTTTTTVDDTNFIQRHTDAVHSTKKNIWHWFIVIFIGSISFNLQFICWTFRADELDYSTNESIVAFLTINQWIFSVMTFAYSALSDKYGFDTITFIATWIGLAGAILQCSEDFYIFSVGTSFRNFVLE